MKQYQPETSALKLNKRLHNLDAQMRRKIDRSLNALAVEFGARRQSMLDEVRKWCDGLSEQVSEAEFYDAVSLLAKVYMTDDFNYAFAADFITHDSLAAWCRREEVPEVSLRRLVLQLLYESFLTRETADGSSYLQHHVDMQRWKPSRTARGLPPEHVRQVDGRWMIADVSLPVGMSWQTSVSELSGFSELAQHIRERIEGLLIHELICRSEKDRRKSLARRLQIQKGIGAKGARTIWLWLNELGCSEV